jgi:hypothetical protein
VDSGAALADRAFAPSSHPYSVAQNRKDATFKNIFIYVLTSFLVKRFITTRFRYEFLRRCLLKLEENHPCALGLKSPWPCANDGLKNRINRPL